MLLKSSLHTRLGPPPADTTSIQLKFHPAVCANTPKVVGACIERDGARHGRPVLPAALDDPTDIAAAASVGRPLNIPVGVAIVRARAARVARGGGKRAIEAFRLINHRVRTGDTSAKAMAQAQGSLLEVLFIRSLWRLLANPGASAWQSPVLVWLTGIPTSIREGHTAGDVPDARNGHPLPEVRIFREQDEGGGRPASARGD